MVQPKAWYASAVLAAAILAATVGHAQTADSPASLLLGQVDFTHDIPNFGGPASLAGPAAVAIDASGHLYVSDPQNNRVLGWKNAFALSNGAPSDLIIGQPDRFSTDCISPQTYLHPAPTAASLCGPVGVAVDSAGNLYVADNGNNRVLEYNQPFSSGVAIGQAAALVFGQLGSMTSNSVNQGGPSNDILAYPLGLALDSAGNLYVGDSGRVLEYNTPLVRTSVPGSGDTTADLVITNSLLHDVDFIPAGLALDAAGDLYVADSYNSAVVEYNAPLKRARTARSVDTLPNLTIGQPNFAAACPTTATPTAQDLCSPTGVAVDSAGNLYVADQGNNRIVEYNTPLKNRAVPGRYISANRVFGQRNLTASVCADGEVTGLAFGPAVQDPAPSASGLCGPAGVAFDSAGDLLTTDSGNHRLLIYNSPLKRTKVRGSGDTVADLALGQIDLVHNTINFGGPGSLYIPVSVAADSSGHLYVADSFNNRVLGWKSAAALTSGASADIVIGQPDLFANQCATSRTGLCLGAPRGGFYEIGQVAVDGIGNLYVVDYNNNRMLEYNRPFNSEVSAGQPANLVFGQNGSFTTRTCIGQQPPRVNAPPRMLNANTLCGPIGVAVDPAGNVYIGDTGDNRVLEYNTPLKMTAVSGSGDTIPDLVFGQPDFSTGRCPTPQGPFLSAETLCRPLGVATDSAGNLYVTDSGNSRVLEYNNPASGNTVANLVFGQNGSFTSSQWTNSYFMENTATQDLFSSDGPSAVAVDSAGNVYISDTQNNRVLEYNTPLANPSAVPTANLVFGQGGSFTSNACAGGGPLSFELFRYGPVPLSAEGLCFPNGLSADASGNLWVADSANSRVLEFANPVAAASRAARR